MSYFYIKPPEGNISLHVLEECVYQRWYYFHRPISDQGNDNFCEYITEGSAYDNTGHFMLNLLAILSGDNNFIHAVIKGEEDLFFRRIQTARPNDLRLLCKSILKITNQIEKVDLESYLSILIILCRKLILKHIAEHVSSVNHNINCKAYNIECHFTLCLPLVAKRQVELNCGIATIPCCKWKDFLRLLFRTHIKSRHTKLKQNLNSNIDPRWREIIAKLSQNISQDTNFSKGTLKHSDIDNASKIFPLCMKSLHLTLRNKHRLSHNDRFRYSLFLKDIGLSLEEAIKFWQLEYSKPSREQTSCSHTWPQDGKKYIYGIRHLYGLEGSRKNYCMVKCKRIQQSSTSEAGCPFQHSDIENIEKLANLKKINNDVWKQILRKKELNLGSEGCKMYKNALISSLLQESNNIPSSHVPVEFYSPVDYYNEIMSISEFKNHA